MSVRLQMVGTGSAFAKAYFNNSALVFDGDFALMIDFGFTAPYSLHRIGFPLDRINGVLITHLHADHIGGLEELSFQMKYVYRKKLKLLVPEDLMFPLWEHSLKAGIESPKEGITGLHDLFDVVPLRENTVHRLSDHLEVELMRTPHIPDKPSYSLFLNRDLFYSSDMKFSRDILDHVHFTRKCRHILHDCQLHPPGAVHATLDELLTLPEEIQEKIHLMHYGDDMEQFIGRTGKMTFLKQHHTYDFE